MRSLVWFKKDLRTTDHAPLSEAMKGGPFVCIYVYEPDQIAAAEFATWHFDFINEGLDDLEKQLKQLNTPLYRLTGHMPEVLNHVFEKFPFEQILSHEETGHDLSFQRDLRVKEWCLEKNIDWQEFVQFGVKRRLGNRDGWSRYWNQQMNKNLITLPEQFSPNKCDLVSKTPSHQQVGLPNEFLPQRQVGGSHQANETLNSFLQNRGQNYRSEMSSPVTAFNSCSRMSPYITYGMISHRSIVKTLKERQAFLRTTSEKDFKLSLNSFSSRLRWHCHFIQKLESEPEIEFQNMNASYDGLRPEKPNEKLFESWKNGQTGYPLIDACMRALKQHGWINFRMRAMLASFSAYHLWLHWREPAQYLGKYFLDFEPGIHYSQFQMQSGTTGINSIRIYSPIKQVLDNDPDGTFIKTYVPELKDIPPEYIAEPHELPPLEQADISFRPGETYPLPIVDHKFVYAEAKKRIFEWKKKPEVREASAKVYTKHGSRSKPFRKRAR